MAQIKEGGFIGDLDELLSQYGQNHKVNPIINAIDSQISHGVEDYSKWQKFVLKAIDITIGQAENRLRGLTDEEKTLLFNCIDNARSFCNETSNNKGDDDFYTTVIQECHEADILQPRHYLDNLSKSLRRNCYDTIIELIFQRISFDVESHKKKEAKRLYIDAYNVISDSNESPDPNRKYVIGRCFFEKADQKGYDPFIWGSISNKIEAFRKKCFKYRGQ